MNDYKLLDAITTTTTAAATGSRPNPSCSTPGDPFADRLRPDLRPVPCRSTMSRATDGMRQSSSSSQSRSHEAEEDGDGTGRRPADASAARDGKLLLLHHHHAACTSATSSASSSSSATITPQSTTKTKTSSGTTDMTKEANDKVRCCVTTEGAAFSPSPEILFLVQQQAKTLSCLSAISKRLEELEVKVCDIQRTVFANSKISSKTKSTMDHHLIPSSSSKCSASGSQQLNVLSDDSGGEYSRTTSGTNVDEDELISLLDQIAKYSQTIRDTQQSQAQQQLASMAMSSPQHHIHHQQPAVHPQQSPHAVSRGLHPDACRDLNHRQHHDHDGAAVDHPSSSPAVLMSDHPVASSHSSAGRLHHHNHHPHAHHHNQAMHQQQQQQQQHRNPSLTHASSHPTRSSMSAFPALRTSAERTDFRSSGHVAVAPAPPAESTVSSLGALLFDPNLSSVLTNLLTPPRSRNRDGF